MKQESETRHPNFAIDPGRQYVIGTAGHIDHGKTALVKALTGIDTDRLPEEKTRGITIDIGFAHFSENVTIIDVPGHERLIKNMVAGVSTIDLVLFVIAADDGVMPQTREHLDIVNLLQIRRGIFVINKIDLAGPEWLLLVEEDLRALLRDTPFRDAPIRKASALSGAGVEDLRGLILQTLASIPARQDFEVYRQPVDRVFSAKGFGTVITGTVLGGKLRVGEEVEIQPSGLVARVRGLQSHDHEVKEVRAGFRAAVNLAGIELEQVERGMALAQPGLYHPVEMFNARLALLQSSPIPLKNNQRIRLHIHTAETFARVTIPHAAELKPGESAFVQIRLEQPVHAAYQDRFIVRQYSPQRTIGGGVVLQTAPFRFRKKYSDLFQQTLHRLESEEAQPRILAAFDRLAAAPLTLWEIKIAANLPLQELQRALKELQSGEILFSENLGGKTVYFSREQLEEVSNRIEETLAGFHRAYPGRPGMGEVEIISRLEKTFLPEALRRALGLGIKSRRIAREGQQLRLAAFTPQLSAKESEKYRELEICYREARFNPPTVKEVLERFALSQKEFKELSKLLREEGKLTYVDETLFFHGSVFPQLEALLREFFSRKPEISVAEFKELTGTTRKHSIPLLEYLDNNGFTERAGDARKPGPRLK
ncbi:MAG: selenocysteine-specific translation elongation factor [Calditrichaceae bacterium]|nr:selenocysteine-specific translation elongation factor [Calditrichia bacterium]NUQ43578.1 selenocysteine-specific translation elongation factor [Calditrichaceae bacterium]